MKKLLFQLDTDIHPSSFDTIVGYDGGADHVIPHGGVTPNNIASLVEGTIFTRAPKDKKNTAIFVGGSNMIAGQALFVAIQKHFFPGFRVSLMLDSNGSNTTAAAAVAKILTSTSLSGKKVVVLGGTGPVGQRAAAMFAQEGAEVTITSRHISGAEKACLAMKQRFKVELKAVEAPTCESRGNAIKNANIVLATGAAGIQLLNPEHWENNSTLEVIADANATPPLGIGGTELFDKGIDRHAKKVWGALGFGPLKLTLHRTCINKLFDDNEQVFDAELIFKLAKEMA